jgi:hypothetical protein
MRLSFLQSNWVKSELFEVPINLAPVTDRADDDGIAASDVTGRAVSKLQQIPL